MISDKYNHRQLVQDYCEEVLSGNVPVGELELLAVKRHRWDLENAHTRGWRFDEKKAERACRFFPMLLRHPVGRWFNEPFELTGWQAFVIWCLHGWRNADTELRRFTNAHLSLGRKNGKSSLGAGMVLQVFYDEQPRDPGAEIYLTAPKLDQSMICMRTAQRMVRMSPALSKRSNILTKVITNTEEDSILRALEHGPSHGHNPSMVVRDEIHEWGEQHRKFLDALTTGSASRAQPLNLALTTSGDPGGESPLWAEEDEYIQQVLRSYKDKVPVSDRTFGFIARYDANDDWRDPSLYRKANPNLGVSVSAEYLDEQRNQAVHQPAKRNTFLRFHCNRPTGSKEKAIDPAVWNSCECFNWEELDLSECYGGMDLGTNYDFAAFSLMFPMEGGRYLLRSWTWTCLDGRLNVDVDPFPGWIKSGYLRANEGNSVSFETVEDHIREILEEVNCLGIVFDPMSAKLMSERLSNVADMFEMVQGYAKYNEPTKTFLTRLPAQRILHTGDPCLNWQADNLIIKRNPAGQWMPDKSHETRKVDGMVAALMAFSLCLFYEDEALDYYENHELESI